MGAPWSGSRGETGRHAGAAAAWVPYGRQQGETGRHAGVEAGVWAPIWAAAEETQDTIEEQEQEHGRPYGRQQRRHRAPCRSRSSSMGAHMGGSSGDTRRHAGAGESKTNLTGEKAETCKAFECMAVLVTVATLRKATYNRNSGRI